MIQSSRKEAGTVNPGPFDVVVLHNVVAEIAGDPARRDCSKEQYQVGKICSERRIFCDDRHIVERLPEKLLEQ